MRIETPRGTVGMPNYEFGTSSVMLAEEFPDMYAKGPLSIDSSLVGLPLCVKDVRQDPRTLYPASLTINVPAGKQ